MMIPAFTMPTNQSKKVNFKVPSVQVCIDYADLPSDLEQELTTSYLDRLDANYDKDKPLTSSLYWTSQDRKAALYWIYLYITEETGLSVDYDCRCGERHQVIFDLQELAEEVTSGDLVKSSIETLGDDFEYRIVPLFGWGEQYLEEMRLLIDDEATAKEKADIKVMRNLLQIFPIGMANAPIPELIEHLVSLKESLTVIEYKKLSNDINTYNQENAFGLKMITNSVGEVRLITPVFDCDNEDKEVSATIKTRLSIPFRDYDYITTL